MRIRTKEQKEKEAKYARDRYHLNKEYREAKLLKMREWSKSNPQKNRPSTPERLAYKAKAQAKYRDKMRKLGLYKNVRGDRNLQNKRWQAKPENKIKREAHLVVSNAIKEGLLKRLPCEVCHTLPSNAHHDDYSKQLDVRWLCNKHHYEHHKKMVK